MDSGFCLNDENTRRGMPTEQVVVAYGGKAERIPPSRAAGRRFNSRRSTWRNALRFSALRKREFLLTILVTGSAGHLGEALMRTLHAAGRPARGVDILPSPFTDAVGSICDRDFVARCMG